MTTKLNTIKYNSKQNIMATLLSLITIVATILQIILFFKIWGMTNDVREIRKMAARTLHGTPSPHPQAYEKTKESSASPKLNIAKGDFVIRKSNGQKMQVESVSENRAFCDTGKLGGYKWFTFDEIEKA